MSTLGRLAGKMPLDGGAFGRHVVTLVVLGMLPLPSAHAQAGGVTLAGSVTDLLGGRLLADAAVFVDSQATTVRTNPKGEFSLPNVAPGVHLLHVRKTGFVPRSFQLDIGGNPDEEIYLGSIALYEVEQPGTLEISGTVTNVLTAKPVSGVIYSLGDQVAGVTGTDGTYRIAGLRPGEWNLRFRRVGYRPLDVRYVAGEEVQQHKFSLDMDPLPVELDEIVIEGEGTTMAFGPLAGFYRRRERGLGDFFTREDIERRGPLEVSELLQATPGITLIQQPNATANVVTVRNCGRPLLFVDGTPLPGVVMDEVLSPEVVGAMEVYRGAFVPIEFQTGSSSGSMGSASCGVILVWTR